MPQLTSEQTRAAALEFLRMAQEIGKYRIQHWNELTQEENQSLSRNQSAIISSAENMLVSSTSLVMEDVEDALAQIKKVNGGLKQSIQRLGKIQKVIDLSAAIVTAAGSIFSQNPVEIAKAFDKLDRQLSH